MSFHCSRPVGSLPPDSGHDVNGGGHVVSAETAAWTLRLFVGREPRDRAEIEFHRNHAEIDSLPRVPPPGLRRHGRVPRLPRSRLAQAVRLRHPAPSSSADPRVRASPPFLRSRRSPGRSRSSAPPPRSTSPTSPPGVALGLSPDHHRKTSEFCYKRDIEAMLERSADLGHEAWPLNLHPGTTSVEST